MLNSHSNLTNQDFIIVECAYASDRDQILLSLKIHKNAQIKEVILASGILEKYPELVLETLQVGVFSHKKNLNDTVSQGDRVEIYRPLYLNPMDARRQRAPAPKRRKF